MVWNFYILILRYYIWNHYTKTSNLMRHRVYNCVFCVFFFKFLTFIWWNLYSTIGWRCASRCILIHLWIILGLLTFLWQKQCELNKNEINYFFFTFDMGICLTWSCNICVGWKGSCQMTSWGYLNHYLAVNEVIWIINCIEISIFF